jgi:hypothetical protein
MAARARTTDSSGVAGYAMLASAILTVVIVSAGPGTGSWLAERDVRRDAAAQAIDELLAELLLEPTEVALLHHEDEVRPADVPARDSLGVRSGRTRGKSGIAMT